MPWRDKDGKPYATLEDYTAGASPCIRQPVDTSKLGRIAIDPNDDAIRARMAREALCRTGNYHMQIAAEFATDEACTALYRMLNP